MSTNGYLRIKTKLDNSDIDKDITELESKINKVQTDNLGLDKEATGLQEEINQYEKLCSEADKYKEKIKQLEVERKTLTLGGLSSTNVPQYNSLTTNIDSMKQKYAQATLELDKQASKIDKVYAKLNKIKAKQTENNAKIQQYKEKIESINVDKVSAELSKTNLHTNNIIKKVGQWALAVLGVRSAYSAIRSAMNTLSQYNKQLATDISYIQYALAKVLEPIIMGFINIIYKLLAYVNYLAQAWFNVNLFAGASSKSFANASKNLSGAVKQAKELNKSTQSFDEMNVVQDNSSSSSDAGISMPSTDLANIKDVKIPEWLVKFKEFCQPVIDFFNMIIEKYGPVEGGIMIIVGALGGLLILKSIINLIKNLGKTVTGVSADFTGFFNSLGKATEIIAILGGLALVITSITGLIDTFSQSGMTLGEVAGLLGIVLGELVGTFILLAVTMSLLTPSWQSMAGAIVIFGGLALVLVTVTNLIDTFSKSGMKLGEVIGSMATILVTIVALMGAVALLGPAMTAGLIPFSVVIVGICALLITMAETLPKILDASSKFIQSIAPVVIVLIRTINECIDNTISILGTVLPPIINSIGSLFNSIFNGISNVVTSVGNTVSRIVDSMGYAVVSIIKSIQGVIQQVGNTITQVATTIIWFINSLGPAINNFVNNVIVAVTKLVNFVVSAVEYLVNRVVDGINGIAGVLNDVPGINIRTKGYVSIPRFRPRLASGGIVDMPGKGVDIGGAIAGEAGREGVLPLTNPQAMEELGREIGKWINVNNVLNNYMDGRLIQRSMNKRKQELAFAMNGR